MCRRCMDWCMRQAQECRPYYRQRTWTIVQPVYGMCVSARGCTLENQGNFDFTRVLAEIAGPPRRFIPDVASRWNAGLGFVFILSCACLWFCQLCNCKLFAPWREYQFHRVPSIEELATRILRLIREVESYLWVCMHWEYTPAHPGYGIFLDYLNI